MFRLAARRFPNAAGVYINFLADEGEERVREAYGPVSWSHLTEIKRQYDPENIFIRNQNFPPPEL